MIAEIVGPDGRVHYRRPPDDPMVEQAKRLAGYSVRLVESETPEERRDTTPARLQELGRSVGGITTDAMGGDNLAVILCSHFADFSDQEPDDEFGWPPDAVEKCNEVLAAIRAHYEQN
jgi:hypothetical protein